MDFEEFSNWRILVADDQDEIHDDFTEMLTTQPPGMLRGDLADVFGTEEKQYTFPEFELLHAKDGMEACDILRVGKERGRPIAVAYVDIRMPPGIDGIETIRRVREVDQDVETVLMTAYTDKSLSDILQNVKPFHKLLYIRKPFAREEIQQVTLSLVGKWNVEQMMRERGRQLTISRERLAAVLNSTGDAMAMFDLDGCLVFANQGYEKLLHITEGELKEMSPKALSEQVQKRFQEPSVYDVGSRFILNDRPDLQDETVVAPMEPRLFHRSIVSVHDGQGEVMGSLYVYRDISKEMEADRMKAEVLRLHAELETSYSFEGLIGDSSVMQRVYSLMRQAAESDVTVLIRGESGTGKELIAKSFHFNSQRKHGPFLAINCAAIPEMLIESELFGHERGAFTGATRQRIGAFERAKGGTILLDEIGDMPLALQAKLLRVLQEREVQRVGGGNTIPIDVRIIAATNRDLKAAVEAREFRADLFFRIAGFPILVPALRHHRMDIPLLANHFLNKHSKRNGRTISGISAAALRLLLRYDWPGNVRELDHAIERAILLETTDVLQAENLPEQLLVATAEHPTPESILSLREVERRAVAHALEATGDNVTLAARALGINRVTLHRKLKRFGLAAKG